MAVPEKEKVKKKKIFQKVIELSRNEEKWKISG